MGDSLLNGCGRSWRWLLLLTALVTGGSSVAALPTQSWNGYHWARSGPLSVQIGANVDAAWGSYVSSAAAQWTAANNIDFVQIAGTTAPANCNPVFGTVQVCNASYGKNGWLGYATVYTSGTVIVEATVKLNDYYFASAQYNTAAWRAQTACQEIGHTLGLAHNNTVKTDPNKGTCMDYTNDPTGLRGTNGTLANLAPAASDFAALDVIYANVDVMPAGKIKAAFRTGDGLSVGDDVETAPQAVPEPATWALLVAGFGGVGALQRRRRIAAA